MSHEEIVELIRDVVQEERKAIGFIQKMKDATSIVGPLMILLSLLNFAFLKASVEPVIDTKLERHQVEARAQMDMVGSHFVQRQEFDAYVSEKGEKWRQQEITNARIEMALIEIQRDIKELLRRGK